MKKKLKLSVIGGGLLATIGIFVVLAATGVGAAIAWAIGLVSGAQSSRRW
jgi:hypothetical protein